MDAVRYVVPFSRIILPKIETDETVISITDDLNNSQVLTEKLSMEIIKMDAYQVKHAYIRIEQKLDGVF
jgi:hypothetical protein